MTDINTYFLSPDATLCDALEVIEKTAGKIALVVKENHELTGTVTDGDIRRAILSKLSLETVISEIMNKTPMTAKESEDRAGLFSLMQAKNIRNIPIVDSNNCIVDILNMSDIIIPQRKDNWVVIMAGGLGTRLYPLTENTPKPMLPIKGSPVLEILIKTFMSQGFHRFYISVNYLSEQIKDHFGDGKKHGIEIRYLEETKPLGTAGALSLLHHRPKDPFIVINGDIVTNVKFADMLHFHATEKTDITMGVREHKVQIPYGVVNLDGHEICDFVEKPTEKYFVNTGIYIVSPDMLDLVPKDTSYTMPDLMKQAQDKNNNVHAFPVTESWLDIGRIEDFERAETLVEQLHYKNRGLI